MTKTEVALAAHGPTQDGIYGTTCWECSTCCGALATVRGGRVVDFAPNPDHPYSKGAFCIKGIRGAPGITYGPDRLLHPMRRAGGRGEGKWSRIGWDEALEEMADRLCEVRRTYGPPAIVGATSGAFFSRSVILALMLRSIGSPNWMINQDLCGGCRAVSARAMGLDIARGEDIERTRCALIVGRNSSIADPVEWAALKAAKKRGARLIVIDPKRTQAAGIADLWLAPRVGTDAALALALLHVMIGENLYDKGFVAASCHGFTQLAERAAQFPPDLAERLTGVPAGQIAAAARMYADGPSTFVSGHGIDAFSAGVQTFRAYHSLVAISGNIDRPGGNLRSRIPAGMRSYMDLLHMAEFRLPPEVEARTIGADRFPLWAGPKGWQTACHNPSVIEAMLTGRPYPVRALYASGVNILVTYPDTARTLAALRTLDFVAVATHTMTPTAEQADLVLPKTTTLEEEEVSFMPSGPTVLFTRAVVPPQGEARSELDIALPLLEKMGHRQAVVRHLLPWRSQREFNASLLGDSGIRIEDLERIGYQGVSPQPRAPRPFATPSGKIELYSAVMEQVGLDPLPGYTAPGHERVSREMAERFPLILITGDREKSYHHSRFRDQDWAIKVSPHPRLTMHPDTARAMGIEDGTWVRLEVAGGKGSCRLRLKLSDATPTDVVNTGMGWWLPRDLAPTRGALDVNINVALAYAGPYDPASGSPDIRGLRCRVTPIAN
ncbi:MAG TPA: molybdopterin-dependent oxidoreductase [Hyphomicrobiaceae bacterium]|jgi:thiosulfate reductase/polysulfide reductase chain A|nr:molybdopterin-dependent oxidoreductase [Hyphomicrobiaceae bacterium]